MDKPTYQLRNGLLYHNETPVIGLGVSYYASYHPQKVPVPANGPREAEMKIDLHEIKQAGFNLVRCAALGNVSLDQGKVKVDFPFVDAMLDEAQEHDLAFMVRLQGYHMILGNYTDGIMLDETGQEMPFHWSWFVRNCINHPGVISDNEIGTKASAKHFASYPAVVGYQIYNEPTYPGKGFYCYNPHTIHAFRNWLRSKYGLNSGRDFDTVEPPRQRPGVTEDTGLWTDWRVFNTERMSQFLCSVGNYAKEVDPEREVFTCLMPIPLTTAAATRGQDYHAVAEGMDLLGLTIYRITKPENLIRSLLVLDAVESSAAVSGKKAWLIELDAAVDLAADDLERESYAVLGRGIKGILYYQWRADYPFPESPEPEKFGIVRSDRSHTGNYDPIIKANALINKISTQLAAAKKMRSGVGILYSMDVMAFHDGLEQITEPLRAMYQFYDAMNQRDMAVDVVRASDLAENSLGIHLLFVPVLEGLTPKELRSLRQFVESGHYLVVGKGRRAQMMAALPATGPITEQIVELDFGDLAQDSVQQLLDLGAVRSHAYIEKANSSDRIEARCLSGDGYFVVVITNFAQLQPAGLVLSMLLNRQLTEVTFYDTAETKSLAWEIAGQSTRITLPEISTGGIIIAKID